MKGSTFHVVGDASVDVVVGIVRVVQTVLVAILAAVINDLEWHLTGEPIR